MIQVNPDTDKYMSLSGPETQCLNVKGGALKLLQPAHPPGFMHGVDFRNLLC